MLTTYAEIYQRDLFESVIPFWMRHSIDREHGGFFTCLDRDGSIYDTRKYMWLNGRQVWTLCKLYNEAEPRQQWLDAASRAVAFLRKHARDEQGRCYFSLTREGLPAAYQRKPYGAVFLAIGLHEYAKASGDETARAEAVELFHSIRRWIAEPALLGRPALAGAPAMSQLAEIMVVTSMALELAAADPTPGYTAILEDCVAKALMHCDPNREILIENVAPDGRFLTDTPEGRLFCPGHAVEVCWFLLHALRHFSDPAAAAPIRAKVLRILENSLIFGWDEDHDGLFYFMDIQGRPPLQLEANMKLWWPHTEALYALVHAYTTTRDARWLRWLDRVHHYTYRTFPDPEYGEWYGYCDRQGKPTHSLKGNSYKGCFHVPRALWMSIREIQEFEHGDVSAG